MFIVSFILIIFLGFLGGFLLNKLKLPKLVGMVIVGILIGPSFLNIIDSSVIDISSEIRQIALIIILTRSGLSLDIKSLKQIGRPALLMCFVPAIFEIVATTLFAPLIINVSYLEALLLGCVLAAVSPAIIVPRMIKLQEEGYSKKNKIPDLILAGSSADDIFVIMLFYLVLGIFEKSSFNISTIIMFPIAIILGISLGIIVGLALRFIIKKIKMHNYIIVFIIFTSSLLMYGLELILKQYIEISSLLGIIFMGIFIFIKTDPIKTDVKKTYNKIWLLFEILLFVLVGISVDVTVAFDYGLSSMLLLFIILFFRSIGVLVCLIKTKYNFREKIFCIIAYLPKATVQASIGGIALSMGFDVGPIVLAVSVLSIIVTAPLGAFLIDSTHKKLLIKNTEDDINLQKI